MGFTKKFINKDMILSTRKSGGRITGLFTVDCVICMDDFTYEIFNMFLLGCSEDELKNHLIRHIHVE